MSRWICTDCSWHAKQGRRIHCPLCCGFTYSEAAEKKRRIHQADLRSQRVAA